MVMQKLYYCLFISENMIIKTVKTTSRMINRVQKNICAEFYILLHCTIFCYNYCDYNIEYFNVGVSFRGQTSGYN